MLQPDQQEQPCKTVLQIRYVPNITVIVGSVVVVIIDYDKSGTVLYIDQIVFIGAVVDGNVILPIVLVIVKIIVCCRSRRKIIVIVVVGVVIVISGLEICMVSIIVIIGCVCI